VRIKFCRSVSALGSHRATGRLIGQRNVRDVLDRGLFQFLIHCDFGTPEDLKHVVPLVSDDPFWCGLPKKTRKLQSPRRERDVRAIVLSKGG